MTEAVQQAKQRVTDELIRRGYTRHQELGVWIGPDGSALSWQNARRREGLFEDSEIAAREREEKGR